MKVAEFAKALNVTEACIRKWILEHRIAVVHVGRLVRIPASEYERLTSEGLRPARQSDITSRTKSHSNMEGGHHD